MRISLAPLHRESSSMGDDASPTMRRAKQHKRESSLFVHERARVSFFAAASHFEEAAWRRTEGSESRRQKHLEKRESTDRIVLVKRARV